MSLVRKADQLIGPDLQQVLYVGGSLGVGTFHLGPGSSAPGPYKALTGAAGSGDGVLTGAGKFAELIIDITNVGGAGTLTTTILGFDAASGKFYTILASAALAAVATTVLRVGPGLTAAANAVANDFMPLAFGIQVVVAGNAVIFTLGLQQQD